MSALTKRTQPDDTKVPMVDGWWASGSCHKSRHKRPLHSNAPSIVHVHLCEPASFKFEPVSGPPKRKLKNGLQRRRLKSTRLAPENRAHTGQSDGRMCLTRQYVGGFHTLGNHIEETGLVGTASLDGRSVTYGLRRSTRAR